MAALNNHLTPLVSTPLPEVEETAGILGSGHGGLLEEAPGLEVAVWGAQESTSFGVGARAGAGGGGPVGVYSGDLRQAKELGSHSSDLRGFGV